MMKNASVFVCKVILAVLLSVLVFLPCGCAYEQPGETVAEGQRRHKRVLRINHQEMMEDIDRFLLLDQPSKLTGRRIP
jgi:PDZ domain-containing secreted protein